MIDEKAMIPFIQAKYLKILDTTDKISSFEEIPQTSASSYAESESSNGLSFCISCEDSRHKRLINVK